MAPVGSLSVAKAAGMPYRSDEPTNPADGCGRCHGSRGQPDEFDNE